MNAPDRIPTTLAPVTEDPRYIGVSVPRSGARRLAEGQGCYIDDMMLPRMGHVVYWRSPVAHMRVTGIDRAAASTMPGVIAVVDGAEIATICKP
ncbi:MAG: xanthine dehydrogenase family protein molybdopterin-binding subunit, partial [Ideonella sp.]|nr:xanthine dehydrogenase family protein molybdopterin-binding subunit [Ideonella sp.]